MIAWGLNDEERAVEAANGPSLRGEPQRLAGLWWAVWASLSILAIGMAARTLGPLPVVTVHPPVLFSGAVVLDKKGEPISNVLSPTQAEREVTLWRAGTKHAANVRCPCSTLLVSVIATLPDSLTHKR